MITQDYTTWFNQIVLDYLNTDVDDTYLEVNEPIMYVMSGQDILMSAEALRLNFGERGLLTFKYVFNQDEGNQAKGYSRWVLRTDMHLKLLRYLEKAKLIQQIRRREFDFLGGARYLRMRQVVARVLGRVRHPQVAYNKLQAESSTDEFEELLEELTGWYNINEFKHVQDKPIDRSALITQRTWNEL